MDRHIDWVGAAAPQRFRAFGLDFISDVDLPAPRVKESERPAPVRIRLGDVPHAIDGATRRGPGCEISAGQLLLAVEGVARYWVRDGQEIVVCPERDAAVASVLLILTGSAIGALLHQRGLLPLHASAVHIAGGCVAFVGPRGAGKSTLAAALHSRGYPVLCDDILPVETPAHEPPRAWPGFSRLKLCPDAIGLVDAPTAARPLGDPKRKREIDLRQTPVEHSLPMLRIYRLGVSTDNEGVTLRPANRTERLTTLLGNTYRSEFLDGLGLLKQHLDACTSTLKGLSIRCLTPARGLSRLGETIERLEEDLTTLERLPAPPALGRRGGQP